MIRFFFFIFFCLRLSLFGLVSPGIEGLIGGDYDHLLRGKRLGLVTNQTGINREMESSISLLRQNSEKLQFRFTALFSPEHGLVGSAHEGEKVAHSKSSHPIPVYSLYGSTRRPTKEMLDHVDLLIFDIQDIGSRSYTYLTTLCYVMEEAAKNGIPVIVTDRPNPINGVTVDGPMLESKWQSMVGYLNIPYCHGMTLGELAHFFNEEYHIGCQLTVVPMMGWKRQMTFADTGLPWIPTSPHIPEPDSPLYYPMTGILGELQLINIGVGYTLPFKLIGAPWIDADRLADKLNKQKFPGVHFQAFHYKPFYGRFKGEECHGVMIRVTDHLSYKPVATQYLLIGVLKALYPREFQHAMNKSRGRQEMFSKVNGTAEVYRILNEENYVVWKLREIHQKERMAFGILREKYLNPSYQ